MKHWYRVPARRKAKLAPPNVRETIIEPGHYAKQYALYEAAEGKDTYAVWFAEAIRPVRAEPSAEDIAEQEHQRIEAHAELMAEQAAFMQRRADAEAREVKRRAAEWKDAQAKMPDTSRPADIGKGINYVGDKPDTRPIGERTGTMGELEIFGRFLVLRPVAPGASCCAYFDKVTGVKIAQTLEGIKRMGPEIVGRIVAR
jgi:hypothetical protein